MRGWDIALKRVHDTRSYVMKRIATFALASLMIAGSGFATTASADPPRNTHGWEASRHGDRSHHNWRRGERLSDYQRAHFRQVDWRHARLREPPRGYHYVRDDNSGEYLLVGIATGIVLGAILASQ
jgi:Ni/Co efflux regulator RcnB